MTITFRHPLRTLTCVLATITMTACMADLDDPAASIDDARDTKLSDDDLSGDVSKAANLALTASTSASSTYCSGTGLHCYDSDRVNDGSRDTTVGGYYSWTNELGLALPQWVAVNFGSSKTFNRVEVYTSAGYPIRDYDIQYLSGSSWYTAVTVRGNTSTHRTHTFSNKTSSRVRVLGYLGPSNQTIYVRVNELEVYYDCTPNSCQPSQCGSVPNGCGGTMYCGPCGGWCGDGVCGPGENTSSCPQDCCLYAPYATDDGDDPDSLIPICPVLE